MVINVIILVDPTEMIQGATRFTIGIIIVSNII